ncbi:MAG: DUF2461 family protein, partial [Chitinophagaceae bacterium]
MRCKLRSFVMLVYLCSFTATGLQAQGKRILRADSIRISYRVGDVFRERSWTITPEAKPDQLDVKITDKPVRVEFISGIDSIGFTVRAGDIHDFYVVADGSKDTAFTRIKGYQYYPPAKFTDAHKKKFKGKTTVEIPEVYELINIVYAITPAAANNADYAYRGSGYYREVKDWFSKYAAEEAVVNINKALNDDQYFILKMDAYAFDWIRGKLVQSKVYDRAAWRDTNTLRPYVKALQAFADKSKFADFYKQHQSFYNSQINCYKDSINTTAMVGWLRKNFPGTDYDVFRIIFSPLVSGNQSANWMEDNGFKEMHAHVNFPYAYPAKDVTPDGALFRRGAIVFTEINHSFINPEIEKYLSADDFKKAFADLSIWLDLNKPAKNYNDAYSCFNEYMNWALVSVYATDAAPPSDTAAIIGAIGKNMKEYRGFKKFPEFNMFITELYRKRPQGATVASLYPAIIKWFAENKNRYEEAKADALNLVSQIIPELSKVDPLISSETDPKKSLM